MQHFDASIRRVQHEAGQEGTDRLEEEARRRAVDGVPDFRLDRHGNEHPFVRYSDTLLMFLLKARDPAKYRGHVKVEHSWPPGGPRELEHRGVSLADLIRVARDAGLVDADGNGKRESGNSS